MAANYIGALKMLHCSRMLEDDEFEGAQAKHTSKPSRRDHRSRRIDAMREWSTGVVDERPVKERFSREFKKPKIKRIKNPIENIGEENCEKGLVVEVHRRTCEVRLENDPTTVVTAMYRATTTKELGEFPTVGDRILLGQVNDGEDDGSGVGSQKYCVVRVFPRKSELRRPGPRDSFYKQQTLAANIDQVIIVASVVQPEFNYGFADRFLLAANLNNLPFVMVLTKMDLLGDAPAKASTICAKSSKGNPPFSAGRAESASRHSSTRSSQMQNSAQVTYANATARAATQLHRRACWISPAEATSSTPRAYAASASWTWKQRPSQRFSPDFSKATFSHASTATACTSRNPDAP